VYLPYTYNGRGVPETCATLVEKVAASGLDVRVYVPRVRKPLPDVVSTHQTLPPPLRLAPWKYIHHMAIWSLDGSFRRAAQRTKASPAVAYFWPSYLHAPSLKLIEYTRARGIPTVREMVNTATSTSGPILDEVYVRHGHPEIHNVTAELIEHETAELTLYDHIFASNDEVERSLIRIGIPESRIHSVSFGWRRERFAARSANGERPDGPVRVLFVGIVGIRKGVPELLTAWERAGVDGELVLVGDLEALIAPLVERAVATGRVRHLPYVDDIASLYRSSDIFVFPSHEEGGPQVTYEAAACGLAIITTPMGAARLVETGTTGVIVPPGDVDTMASAIRQLAESPELRRRLGLAAREAADSFEYDVVGRRRAEILRQVALGER
jgi:glycosyltransferase involved in cell wall biosynthesis